MEFINRVSSPMNPYSEDALETKEELDAARDEVLKQQKKTAPFLVGSIAKVNDRITNLDRELQDLATGLVIESRQSFGEDEYPLISPRFDEGPKAAKDVKELNQFAGVYAVKSMLQVDKSDKGKHLLKNMSGSRKQQKDKTGTKPRLVELHQYPGYESDRLTQLPEVPARVILNTVTKAQLDLERKPHYKIEFKRLFHSKMSEAILLDTFWYLFLHRYHPSRVVQSRLFNRISHNYVKLLLSAKQPKYRDVFFRSYADILAQAVYAAYCAAFPNSWRQFDDSFKEDLCGLTSEWVVGTKQAPRRWAVWNFDDLEPNDMKKDDFSKRDKKKGGMLNFESSSSSSSQILADAGGNRSTIADDESSLISAVADAQSISSISTSCQPKDKFRKQNSTCDVTKNTSKPALQTISELSAENSSLDMLHGGGGGGWEGGKEIKGKTCTSKKKGVGSVVSKKSDSRTRVGGKSSDLTARPSISRTSINKKTEKKESHPAREGPTFIKHVFNVEGRSPLVAHFMKQQGLERTAGMDVLLQRTEIDKLPSSTAPTYQDIIQETFQKVRHMKDTYQHMHEEGVKEHTHFLTQQRAKLHDHMRRENALMGHPREVKKLSDLLVLELLKDQGEVSTGAAQAVEEALRYYADQD
ncbi:protein FAM227A isoform X2 [Strongylocentrotus purpuratus]|uniref:Protein FAM227A n=1 Tax=Strongylocentrotus purpuratus TaxID=7668 RepID=A0A7M7NPQ5_STRPU|nr:protein FAM227A isoform X2 [Strongylocentrotus purpuratus]